jgi:quercetin dioxygenase-like cupin family protein
MVRQHRYEQPTTTDDNAALRRLLDIERVSSRSVYPGEGVWVGPKTLFSNPATNQLQAFIRSCLPPGNWHLQGWGVVLDAGARLERHDHKFPGNVWSGVYYPAGGVGEIEFDDESYRPEESTLIVFPSDKPHSVTATERRYSIAFNARS